LAAEGYGSFQSARRTFAGNQKQGAWSGKVEYAAWQKRMRSVNLSIGKLFGLAA
jgi:hypothetical protein